MNRIKRIWIRLRYYLSNWIRPNHSSRAIYREMVMSQTRINSRGLGDEAHLEEVHKVIMRLLFEGNAIYEIVFTKNNLKQITTTIIYFINKNYI